MPWSAAPPRLDAMEKRFEDWCRRVTEQVRFKPDRWEIAKELEAHYEDHVRDLERLGYDRPLAEERSLKAMGDPEEVGRAIDKAHKPLLGWLWEASRGLILLAVVLLLGNAAFSGYSWPDLRDWSLFSRQEEELAGWEVTELACPAPFQAGAYTITIDRARYQTAENGKGMLYLDVTCRTKQFWLDSPDLWDTLEATDSKGALYRGWHAPWINGFQDHDSHLLYRGQIQVEQIAGAPEWIEVTHPIGGWSFRVPLPEGGEAP